MIKEKGELLKYCIRNKLTLIGLAQKVGMSKWEIQKLNWNPKREIRVSNVEKLYLGTLDLNPPLTPDIYLEYGVFRHNINQDENPEN